jgi:thiaminase/transcriptional activator TenA
MAERFTERLHQRASAIWEAQHQHPFVREIGDGALSLDRFQFWLRQDYVFLIEYSRVLALAAARSPDLETILRFATLLKETVDTEMRLHRSYAAEFDIGPEDLEREPPAPVTRAYTDFLLRVAATGDFAEFRSRCAADACACSWVRFFTGINISSPPRSTM